MKAPINICWFRRDLRLKDHAALYHALKAGLPVLPVFIFDSNILDLLENKADRRVQFIHDAIAEMQVVLEEMGSTMQVMYGRPEAVFNQLLEQYNINTVFVNHDYEHYDKEQDNKIYTLLKEKNVGMQHFKDQVIFEKDEVIKDDGSPYTVFTPYSKKWKAKLKDFYFSFGERIHERAAINTQLTETDLMNSEVHQRNGQ